MDVARENLKTTQQNLKTTQQNLKTTQQNLKTTQQNLKTTKKEAGSEEEPSVDFHYRELQYSIGDKKIKTLQVPELRISHQSRQKIESVLGEDLANRFLHVLHGVFRHSYGKKLSGDKLFCLAEKAINFSRAWDRSKKDQVKLKLDFIHILDLLDKLPELIALKNTGLPKDILTALNEVVKKQANSRLSNVLHKLLKAGQAVNEAIPVVPPLAREESNSPRKKLEQKLHDFVNGKGPETESSATGKALDWLIPDLTNIPDPFCRNYRHYQEGYSNC